MTSISERLLLAYARKFPVRRGKYRIIDRFGRGHGANTRRVAKLAYGDFVMDCDLNKMLQRQFYFFGTYLLEERVIDRWVEYSKESKYIFDIGANAGIYSLAAAAIQPRSEIHAFEPTADIAEHLNNTVKRNHLEACINVHTCAVAGESGMAYLNMFAGEYENNEGMNFISNDRRSPNSVAVSTISLDDFCVGRRIETIDLVKIDVQGNEPEVFSGAQRLIRTGGLKTIFFELNWEPSKMKECAASRAVSILSAAGYQFADPNRDMRFRDAGPWLRGLSDVVAAIC